MRMSESTRWITQCLALPGRRKSARSSSTPGLPHLLAWHGAIRAILCMTESTLPRGALVICPCLVSYLSGWILTVSAVHQVPHSHSLLPESRSLYPLPMPCQCEPLGLNKSALWPLAISVSKVDGPPCRELTFVIRICFRWGSRNSL